MGLSPGDIDCISLDAQQAQRCNQRVFWRWLVDGCQKYHVTWEGLCELLDDVEYGETRNELKNALASNGVHVDYPKDNDN